MRMKIIILKIFVLLSLFFSSALFADLGEKKVRLSGLVKEQTSKRITMKEIEKLAMVEEKIFNPYEKKSDLYGGVMLEKFVQKYAKESVKEVVFTAIDDYQIIITKEEWLSMRIILSTRMNGSYIPIRSKGPLRIVYPDYDASKKEYMVNLSHWIWMIKKIEFR